MTPAPRHHRLAAFAAMSLLAGCSGNSSPSAGPINSGQPHSGSVPLPITSSNTSSLPPGVPTSTQTGAVFTATDRAGNAVSLTIGVGQVEPADKITDSLIQTCADNIAGIGSSLDRALAVQLTVHVQVKSALATTVALRLADDYLTEIGGQPDGAGANTSLIFFAKKYSDGLQCGSLPPDVSDAATVTWKNATIAGSYTWQLYAIQANALTPNDPTGTHSNLRKLLINPEVFLTDPQAVDLKYDDANSPFEVQCQYPLGQGGGRPFVAVDPVTAVQLGCQMP